MRPATPRPSRLEQAIDRSLDGSAARAGARAGGRRPLPRASSEPGRFDRVFGGQTVAQALVAAGADRRPDKDPHSLHAYFVEAGAPDEALELTVERVRDGRSMSTRRVTVTQGDRTLLIAIASFHANPAAPELADVAAARSRHPTSCRVLQDWVHDAAAGRSRAHA